MSIRDWLFGRKEAMDQKTTKFFRKRGQWTDWIYGITEGDVAPGSGRMIAECYSIMCPKGERGPVETSGIQAVSEGEFREAVLSFMKERLTEDECARQVRRLDREIGAALGIKGSGKCTKCQGSGKVYARRDIQHTHGMDCSSCKGSGKCEYCHGAGEESYGERKPCKFCW